MVEFSLLICFRVKSTIIDSGIFKQFLINKRKSLNMDIYTLILTKKIDEY